MSTYYVCMNITLAIDEKLLERAREKLSATGKTVNQEIREHLQLIAGKDDQLTRDLEYLRTHFGAGKSQGWNYGREDAYEGRLEWPRK